LGASFSDALPETAPALASRVVVESHLRHHRKPVASAAGLIAPLPPRIRPALTPAAPGHAKLWPGA
jgi:hypothetical protein